MKSLKSLPLWFISALLVGCASKPESSAPATNASDAPKPVAQSTPEAGAPEKKPEAPALAPVREADLPANLKHEAFAYYGLSNLKPVNLTITDSSTKEVRTGTRVIELTEIKDGKATYVQKQSGALQDNGDVTLSLEADGIYAMGSTVGKMKPHSLEMPAKLTIGGGWKDRTEMDREQGAIKLDNQLKIERIEKVKVPTGTFDALYVTSTGQGTLGTSKATLQTKSWYVKGRGAVKQEISVTMAGQPKRTLIVQEAK